MGYVTPIKDRTATDIANRTSKAFVNVADWIRIYYNAQYTSSLASIQLGSNIVFNAVTPDPVTTDFPSVIKFNTLLNNIELIRLAVIALSISGTSTEIKDDYVAGINEEAPDYIDVNLWESTIDAIWDHYSGDALEVCPTLTANLTVTTGTNKIYVDCLDTADFDVDIQGTGNLYII